MDCGKLVLVVLLSLQLTFISGAAADDFLAPLSQDICDGVVCGMGTCQAALNQTPGFICQCDAGWQQLLLHDLQFPFLPCIVPNCTIDYSCSNGTSAEGPAAPAPVSTPSPPPVTSDVLYEVCDHVYCGGGSCVKTSFFTYQCTCNDGYYNIMNNTHFPCYRKCSLGADCQKQGVTFTNTSAVTVSSSPSSSPNFHSSKSTKLAGTNQLGLLAPILLVSALAFY